MTYKISTLTQLTTAISFLCLGFRLWVLPILFFWLGVRLHQEVLEKEGATERYWILTTLVCSCLNPFKFRVGVLCLDKPLSYFRSLGSIKYSTLITDICHHLSYLSLGTSIYFEGNLWYLHCVTTFPDCGW